MGLLFQFKKPEIRQFNYTPRYWNPQKEEMQERRERIRRQMQSGERRHTGGEGSELQRGFLANARKTKSATGGHTLLVALLFTVGVGVLYCVF